METKTYTVTLSDGTQISDLKLNGNNFICKDELTKDDFAGKLSEVIIDDGETQQIMHNCELVQITECEGEYWFVLRELSAEELKLMQMSADIDYLTMITEDL